jgi:hypothetical protein
MKSLFFLFIVLLVLPVGILNAQQMSWEKDDQLYVTLHEDSVIKLNVNTLPHSGTNPEANQGKFTYYPATLSKTFVNQLKGKEVEVLDTLTEEQHSMTLWGTVNGTLGGGWVHFVNCLLYALETNKLNIYSPLMKRPESNWKPRPMTESFKRTKKWEYYIPVTQKNAIKEYKACQKNDELQNLTGVPDEFIELFLNTSDKDLKKMKENRRFKDLAKINLVKLLLGSKYLGAVQIKYIENMVLQAVQLYSADLPSVIILDDYSAAVMLSLNEHGYQVENLEFRGKEFLTKEELESRKKKIYSVIDKINQVNKELLKERLGEYYKK